MRSLAALFFLALTGCAGSTPLIWLPPDEFIHPFNGRVEVQHLVYRGGPLLAMSKRYDRICVLYLPGVGEPGIDESVRRVLVVYETAECNGAKDINNPLRKAEMPFSEQLAYSRAAFMNPRKDKEMYERVTNTNKR